MLKIYQNQSAPTMTSREIAELTGKAHKEVTRDIENTLAQAEIDARIFAHTYKDTQNRQQREYRLPKRECDLVVSGYSVKYRLAIIDRWQELENKNNPMAIAATMNSAQLSVLMAETQAKEQAMQQLALAQPAVEFVDRYVKSTGNLGFRQVCKLLKAKENDFRAFLQDNKIMYRLGSDWVPYAPHIDAGRFHVTAGTGDNDHNFTSAKFTPKGVEWVSIKWMAKELNDFIIKDLEQDSK